MLIRGQTAIFALAIASCAGCGEADNRPKRVPVSGTVMFNQQPVEGASVVFSPQGHSNAATGRTDALGRFQLRTFGANDGAVPGDYKVTVRKTEIVGGVAAGGDGDGGGADAPPASERSLIPDKYGRPEASGLEATVNSEGENNFTFELQGTASTTATAPVRSEAPSRATGE
jgi:hypothetical protein